MFIFNYDERFSSDPRHKLTLKCLKMIIQWIGSLLNVLHIYNPQVKGITCSYIYYRGGKLVRREETHPLLSTVIDNWKPLNAISPTEIRTHSCSNPTSNWFQSRRRPLTIHIYTYRNTNLHSNTISYGTSSAHRTCKYIYMIYYIDIIVCML